MRSREQVLLQFYSKFRGQRPTVIDAFSRQPIGYWLGMCALLAIMAAVAIYADLPATELLLGMIVGAVLRDAGWMLRFKRDWPVLDRVLNWDEVERRLVEQVSSKAPD